MKKMVLLFWLVTWVEIQAVENPMGYPGDAVMHYAGCHIENNGQEAKFDDESKARMFIETNKGDRLKYDFKIFEVKEKK